MDFDLLLNQKARMKIKSAEAGNTPAQAHAQDSGQGRGQKRITQETARIRDGLLTQPDLCDHADAYIPYLQAAVQKSITDFRKNFVGS